MSSDALNQRFIYIPFRAFVFSLCLHLVLLLGYVTVKVLDHFGIHLFERRSRIEMYQNFIQVDMVALPDELLNEKREVDPTLAIVDKAKTAAETVPPVASKDGSPSKSNAAEEEIMAEKIRVEKQQKAKDEAKRLAQERKERERALKKLQEEASREAALKSLARARNGKAGRQKVLGNVLSKGTSMTGIIGTARDRYQALVRQKIREHFKIYPWQRKKGLVSVVTIFLLPNGRVSQKKVIKPSADTLYNSAVLQAIEEAQPLPVPEDRSLISDGITVEFRPED